LALYCARDDYSAPRNTPAFADMASYLEYVVIWIVPDKAANYRFTTPSLLMDNCEVNGFYQSNAS